MRTSRSRNRTLATFPYVSAGFTVKYIQRTLGTGLNVYSEPVYSFSAIAQDIETMVDTINTGLKTPQYVYNDSYLSGDPRYNAIRHHRTSLRCTSGSPFIVTAPPTLDFPFSEISHSGMLPNPGHVFYSFSSPHTYLANAGKILTNQSPITSTVGRGAISGLLTDAKLLNVESINILAFIGELKDIRKIVSLFKIDRLDDTFVTDKYLGVNLGLLPFAGDIKKIVDLIKSVSPALDKWNSMAKAGKTMNQHSTFQDSTSKGNLVVNNLGFVRGGTAFGYRVELSYEQTHKAKAHCYFRPREIDPDLVDDLYRNIWGLNRVLGAAWELLPFSFVIDWFINIGDAIDNIERSAPVLKADISSAGYSFAQNTNIVSKVYYIEALTGTSHFIGSTVYTDETFVRYPVNPSDVLSPDKVIGPLEFKSSTTGYQASIASSLLYQRLRS